MEPSPELIDATGYTEDRYGKRLACPACGGQGRCPHCAPVPSQRAAVG